MQCVFDDFLICIKSVSSSWGEKEPTEAIESNTSIVDHDIDSIRVLLLQKVSEGMNAPHITDVKRLEPDRGLSAVLGKNLRFLESGIAVQDFDSFVTTLCGACRQIDKEWT